MLKPEDNEKLVRVGPGTPGGTMLRAYWQPALMSSELPENDGAPVRVRILGEDLIAFRDTEGKVGLVDAFCPHRRAPMFFGRNEECGLRCVYHGWKFDRDGTCVDMPSEPADSLFKTKVTIAAYPTHEAGGVVWTYMGPKSQQPPPPNYEWMRAPATHCRVSKTYEHANWMQALEGGLDTSHSSFAHNERLGDKNWIRNRDGAPRLDVERTDYGYRYISTRNMGDDGQYIRVYQYILPAQALRGGVTSWTGIGKADVPRLDGHIWVPIDDESCWAYNMVWSYDADVPITEEWHIKDETRFGRGPDDLIPGTFALKKNLSNDFMIDRQMQKTKNYTGIVGINTQDFALQEGMGPIVDRSKEHLGTSDKAIIVCRQLLLEAIDTVGAGEPPKGIDPSTYETVRPYDAVIPHGKEWQVEFAPELVAKF
jgi:phenylpropionate dioxygenase-like ring-hydroxylating dioxygenase large terminal subunit